MLEAAVYVVSSFWFGALHAATPGHGKTVAAAYLVGARGRVVDAITLGVVVTLSHTLGIVVFGAVASLSSAALLPTVLEPYFLLGTGLLIVVIGAGMLRDQSAWLLARLRRAATRRGTRDERPKTRGEEGVRSEVLGVRGRGFLPLGPNTQHLTPRTQSGTRHPHVGSHQRHGHPHARVAALQRTPSEAGVSGDARPPGGMLAGELGGHEHAADGRHRHGFWGHRHSHAEVAAIQGRPPSFGLLVALGVAGGVMPDPGALAVLLSALASGRLVLGLLTVLVFSLGFAAVLVLVGVIAGKAGALLLERIAASDWVGWLQMASAGVIAVYGIVLTLGALRAIGGLA
jgi:nickel/cobalt exporter